MGVDHKEFAVSREKWPRIEHLLPENSVRTVDEIRASH